MTARGAQRIVLVGDVHGDRARLERSLALLGDSRADLLLLTGDVGVDPPWHRAQRITHRAEHDASVAAILACAAELCRSPVVFVPGNHDLPDPPPHPQAVNADGRVVEVAGLSIAGFGGAGPTTFGFAYEWTEEEGERRLQESFAGIASPDILLSHNPPAGTALDRTERGPNVGSPAVKRAIAGLRPALFVCGHIHEAWGVEWLDGVPCVNAGGLGEPYGREIVWSVDWDAGPATLRSLVRGADGRPRERVWSAGQSAAG